MRRAMSRGGLTVKKSANVATLTPARIGTAAASRRIRYRPISASLREPAQRSPSGRGEREGDEDREPEGPEDGAVPAGASALAGGGIEAQILHRVVRDAVGFRVAQPRV